MNTNEEHIKSHFPALYKTPFAPCWANVNTNFQSGGLLPSQPVNHISQLRQTGLFHHFCPLSQDWGHCPLPGRGLCPPSLQGCRYKPAGCFPAVEKETASCSLRNNECKRFRLKKATDTEMSAPFSLKATQCQLSPCSGSCLSCNMGTLHYTAQQWQHRPLEQRKGFQDLILPMLFWWSQGHQLHLSAEDLTALPCLCSRDMPKKRWPCKEQALCVILQTCMVTYKPIIRYAPTNSNLC